MASFVKSQTEARTSVQTYILIRHAETHSNMRARWHGDSDESISMQGRQAAMAAARRLCQLNVRPGLIMSSGLRRAVQTADIFGQFLDAPETVRETSLGERDMGDWKGLAPAEVEARWPGVLSAWEAGLVGGPPNGETDAAVTARALGVLTKFAGAGSGPTLVVTHGGVIRSLRKAAGLVNIPVPHLGGCRARVLTDEDEWWIDDEIVLGDPSARPKT